MALLQEVLVADTPSYLKRIPVGLAGAAVEGLGVPGSALEALLSAGNYGIEAATGKKNVLPTRIGIPGGRNEKLGIQLPNLFLPTIEEIRRGVVEPVAQATVGKESLQPQGTLEEIGQMIARGAPLTLATLGTSTPLQALGQSAASATAMKTAEKLGAPIPIQILAGIGGDRGFTKLSNWMNKSKIPVQNLASLADQEKNALYAKEGQLGSKIVTKADTYKNNLEKVSHDINKLNPNTRLSTGDLKEIDSKVNSLLNDFTGKGITADKLIDRRAELNDIITNTRGHEKELYQLIKKGLNESVAELKPKHADWSKALEGADAIHQAQNFKQTLIDAVDAFPKLGKVLTSPLAGAAAIAFPSLYFTGDPLKALATFGGAYGAGKTLGKGLDVLPFLSGEAPRRVLAEATSQVLNRNLPAAARSYSKLNKMADDYEQKQERTRIRREKEKKKATQHLIPLSSLS